MQHKVHQHKIPAKQGAKHETPYPDIITQVNQDDEKKFQILDFLNVYKCCSFISRCLYTKKARSFTPIVESPPALLEPQLSHHKGKKTLVLDLDETLVHSTFEPVEDPDLILPVRIQGSIYRINVMKRPGIEEFLAKVGKHFEVVVFTASLAEYAEPLVKLLDTTNVVTHLLFRQHCTPLNGIYVKDMALLGRDLKNIILIDNSPNSFLFQPENAYHIKNFFTDKTDRELYRLASFLEKIAYVDDVRPIEDYRKKLEVSHPHHVIKFVKVNQQELVEPDAEESVHELSKPAAKKKEDKERAYNIETEPDLRKDDREGEFPSLFPSEKKRLSPNFYSKAGPLTERIVVNDRLLAQGLDSSEIDLELPSPKESDTLINHREAGIFLDNNSNSSDSSKNNKKKAKVPPFAQHDLGVFSTGNQKNFYTTVDDPSLQGQEVEDVRFLTGVENLNSPLGKQVKIEFDNNMKAVN